MRVLVACEFSGTVRDAFARRGHDAWSCDLKPSETPGNHIIGDVLKILGDGWDLMICHPPCTHLAVSGAWLFKEKRKRQRAALKFVLELLNAPIHAICLENPVSVISSKIRQPDQIINPYQFGHSAKKSTCLWLKNLPPLRPTLWVPKGRTEVWYAKGKGEARQAERARTYPGIAEAMASQWNRRFKIGLGLATEINFKERRNEQD